MSRDSLQVTDAAEVYAIAGATIVHSPRKVAPILSNPFSTVITSFYL